MIYVTHDQTEALTFADQVVVMNTGEIVQTGTPIELFEKPKHTFVGHFIGSPGMNFLPCDVKGGKASIGGATLDAVNAKDAKTGKLEFGIRPEFVSLAAKGMDADVVKVSDIGRVRVVETRIASGHAVKLVVPEGIDIPAQKAKLAFDATRSFIYQDSWLAGAAR
jgi:glycerol transport system ATP-binding protein